MTSATPRDAAAPPLLEVRGLKTYFFTEEGVVQAVDGVDLELRRGETLGLVGESGSGKSVTSLSIMRLIAYPGRIVEGSVHFDGRDLAGLDDEAMRQIRGNRISMVFQQPTTCLNPRRRTDHRGAAGPSLADARGGARPLSRADGAGRPARSRAPHGPVPPRAIGRPVPARDDRDGAGMRSGAADRR
jgi:ABC-type uncharacterized transport system ATPase component